MSSERSGPLKAVGYLKSFSLVSLLKSVLERSKSPLTFVISLLSVSIIYFSQWEYWWPAIILLQSTLCVLGSTISGCRFLAVAFLTLLVLFNYSWFNTKPQIPETCRDKLDSLVGTVKSDSYIKSETIDLIKCSVFCADKQFTIPVVRLTVGLPAKRPKFYFRPGDSVEIKNLHIVKAALFSLSVTPTTQFRMYNLSEQARILKRSQLLVFIQSKARYYLDDFPLAVFKSLLTADRSNLDARWKLTFKQLGVFHIFAISGMHIGILFLWLTFVFRKLISFPNAFVLKGYGTLVSDFASVLMIGLFLDMIGMPISAERAVLMLAWWLFIKHFLYWQPLPFVLTSVALVILLENPAVIGQVSFQLSFLSVAGILAILPLLPITQGADSLATRAAKYALSTLAISCWLLLFTLPIVQDLSDQQSVLAPFNNLIHIAFISFIFLPLLLMTLLHNLVAFYLGLSFGERYLYALVNLAARLWETLLNVNTWINSPFLVNIPLGWNEFSRPLYWLSLLLGAYLLSLLKHRKRVS